MSSCGNVEFVKFGQNMHPHNGYDQEVITDREGNTKKLKIASQDKQNTTLQNSGPREWLGLTS